MIEVVPIPAASIEPVVLTFGQDWSHQVIRRFERSEGYEHACQSRDSMIELDDQKIGRAFED